MFDIVNTERSTQAVFIQLTHKGDLFFFSFLSIFSILTTPFAFWHGSWFSQSVYPLLLWCCLCLLLCASCLFKDWVWHSHGIWCLCDCIKRMCGLRQQWTGTNPAAALHWTAPCFTPTSAYFGRDLQTSLKTCHPSHMLQIFFPPSSTHDYVPWSITHFQTLWSFHIEKCYFLILEILKMVLLLCLLLLHHSFCPFTSHSANQHLPFWRAVIE